MTTTTTGFPLDIAGFAPQPHITKVHMVFKSLPYAPDVSPHAVGLVPFRVDHPMEEQLRAFAHSHGHYNCDLSAIALAGMAHV